MAYFSQFSKAFASSQPILRTKEELFKDRHAIVSQKDVEDLKRQLEDLCAEGIICPTQDVSRTPKGITINMMYQMSYDYQWFTDRSVPDMYDDRSIETILNFLVGYKIYSVLGLVSHLSQVPMYPGEREDPYCIRPVGFYEKERMQSGYCDILTKYQKMFRLILKDFDMKELVVFLDYVVIFASTYEEHQERIVRTLETLQKEGLKVSLDKSYFCSPEFTYAGHLVLDKGILIAPEKVDTLLNWPVPKAVLELQSFLEFCAYYRHFYPGFSAMAKPLYRLLYSMSQDPPKQGTPKSTTEGAQQPKKPWWTRASLEGKWTKECTEAFEGLKSAFSRAPMLEKVDMSRGR